MPDLANEKLQVIATISELNFPTISVSHLIVSWGLQEPEENPDHRTMPYAQGRKIHS